MITCRGIAYDTGSNFATGQGTLSRNQWNDELMRDEIALISDANANSVTVYGTDLDRLRATTTEALDRGMRVLLDPRLVDHPERDVIDHLAEVARLAESFRAQGADIDLTVGSAHAIFVPGIVVGDQYHERMANIYAEHEHFLLHPTAKIDVAECAPRLNDFLGRAVAVARGIFKGAVSYAAPPFEPVDWRPFDFVSLMYFYLPTYRTPDEHMSLLAGYREWDRPVHIAGYGSASYRGAEQRAFFSWDIVDRSADDELTIVEGNVRDEGVQAAYHRKMLGIFELAGIAGATVTELIHPTHPYSDDPRLDLDMSSLSIVKTIRDDLSDHESPYRREPKESFHAIAAHYARCRDQQAA